MGFGVLAVADFVAVGLFCGVLWVCWCCYIGALVVVVLHFFFLAMNWWPVVVMVVVVAVANGRSGCGGCCGFFLGCGI